MASDGSFAALAGLLSGLATSHTNPGSKHLPLDQAVKNVELPGEQSDGKAAVVAEITALARRIHELEARAAVAPSSSLPATPNEPPVSSFPSQSVSNISSPITDKPLPPAPTSAPHGHDAADSPPRDRSGSWVKELLSATEGSSPDTMTRQLTEAQLNRLREHVEDQARMIKQQSAYIDSTNAKIKQQQRATEVVLGGIGDSMDDVETLKRELSKNQQINLTYQKVLREIGSIVTAVANGDLSKKVLINPKERDPEIATFKRTINRMVDQLQEFSSQVTHLAKEVGTEGRLGGQANLPGVNGIWAELTQNGTLACCLRITRLTLFKSTSWPKTLQIKSVRSPSSRLQSLAGI